MVKSDNSMTAKRIDLILISFILTACCIMLSGCGLFPKEEVFETTALVKEDEEPGATAETPETGAEGDGEEQEIFTIQVTKEELEAIKSILDKVEYEDDGSADAEAAAAVVSAMDNENIYGPADE